MNPSFVSLLPFLKALQRKPGTAQDQNESKPSPTQAKPAQIPLGGAPPPPGVPSDYWKRIGEQKQNEARSASALARGNRSVITYPDGTRETRKGNHPQRDNNPGNMEAGDFTRSHNAVGRDKGFAIFPSAEAGFGAMDARLKTADWQALTVDQAIHKWAPPKDAKGHTINDTVGYQRKVRAAVGVSGDTKLSSLSPAQFEALKQTIAQIEGFYENRPGKKVKVIRELPKRPNNIPRR